MTVVVRSAFSRVTVFRFNADVGTVSASWAVATTIDAVAELPAAIVAGGSSTVIVTG
ncbi:hypothetical protein [Amycolatopsis sp. NPDC051102]|uniref:hypothetical protein n=1 Tax=Amycolatopsis sp. NPDC051102 TaxID=3155163 RepID=UPI00341224BE